MSEKPATTGTILVRNLLWDWQIGVRAGDAKTGNDHFGQSRDSESVGNAGLGAWHSDTFGTRQLDESVSAAPIRAAARTGSVADILYFTHLV
jgi:hypothetical protein